MAETMGRVDVEELGRSAVDVEAKSRLFRERLAKDALAGLTRDEFRRLLARIFSTRGKTGRILASMAACARRRAELLHGEAPVERRLESFVESLQARRGRGRPAETCGSTSRASSCTSPTPSGTGCGRAGCGIPTPARAPCRS
jgi:hypothetical protein